MELDANTVFKSIVSKLDLFYPLVKLVNSRDVLTSTDLAPYFNGDIINEILSLQDIYLKSGKLRSCGNPSFVHSLRCVIWSTALGSDLFVSRVALYHDYVEDFAKSLFSYDKFFSSVPVDLKESISFLTNKYRVIVNSLDFSSGLSSVSRQLTELSSNSFLSVPASHILSFISNEDDFDKDFFLINHYELYLFDLVSYVSSSHDDSALLAKFFDRLDNTLTDLPSKFDTIIRIYAKNYLLLKLSRDYVVSSSNPMLKLLFSILQLRSLDQAKSMRVRYADMSVYRGNFYGQQYLKICSDLDLEGHKLAKFSCDVDSFLSDSSVISLLDSILKG